MNWDTYKQLPFELREEYKHRFGDVPQPSCNNIFTMTIVLISMLTVLVFSSYLIFTTETFVELRDMYGGIMKGAYNIAKVGVSVVLIYLLSDIVRFVWYYGRRYRWLKKHNIKRQKETFWW